MRQAYIMKLENVRNVMANSVFNVQKEMTSFKLLKAWLHPDMWKQNETALRLPVNIMKASSVFGARRKLRTILDIVIGKYVAS
mgnify:FL=1